MFQTLLTFGLPIRIAKTAIECPHLCPCLLQLFPVNSCCIMIVRRLSILRENGVQAASTYAGAFHLLSSLGSLPACCRPTQEFLIR